MNSLIEINNKSLLIINIKNQGLIILKKLSSVICGIYLLDGNKKLIDSNFSVFKINREKTEKFNGKIKILIKDDDGDDDKMKDDEMQDVDDSNKYYLFMDYIMSDSSLLSLNAPTPPMCPHIPEHDDSESETEIERRIAEFNLNRQLTNPRAAARARQAHNRRLRRRIENGVTDWHNAEIY